MAAHLNSRLVNPTVVSLISDIFLDFCNKLQVLNVTIWWKVDLDPNFDYVL